MSLYFYKINISDRADYKGWSGDLMDETGHTMWGLLSSIKYENKRNHFLEEATQYLKSKGIKEFSFVKLPESATYGDDDSILKILYFENRRLIDENEKLKRLINDTHKNSH